MQPPTNAQGGLRLTGSSSKLLPLCLVALLACTVLAAALAQTTGERDPRRAVVAFLEGKAECTFGGETKPVDVGMLIPPGATLSTVGKSELVLFFRQIGTMVRLRANTTVVLEKMNKFVRDDTLLKETILDLKSGEMMAVVRVLVEDSLFAIKIPDHVAKFDGAGTGRFDLNAKGTILVGKRSERPLRVSGTKLQGDGILVEPGTVYSSSTLRTAPASERVLKQLRPKLDHLEKLAKALTPPPSPQELPRHKRR